MAATRFIAEHDTISGVVHVTAPDPVQNRDMMAALRTAVHRPWSPPTPKPLVHVGALLMRTDPALALTGRRCVPQRLLDAGFEFQHPHFAPAIGDLLAPATMRTTFTLDTVLAEQARSLGVNVSAAARVGVVAAVGAALEASDRKAYQLRPEVIDEGWVEAEA